MRTRLSFKSVLLLSVGFALPSACGSDDSDRGTLGSVGGVAGKGGATGLDGGAGQSSHDNAGSPSLAGEGGAAPGGAAGGRPAQDAGGVGAGAGAAGDAGVPNTGGAAGRDSGATGGADAAGSGGTAFGGAGGDGSVCDGFTSANGACEPLTAALSGLRWEIPCITHPSQIACTAADPEAVATSLSAVPAGLYEVTLRFRGVVELEGYTPMPESGTWIENAVPAGDGNNIYSLQISDPATTFYLNAGVHQPYCQAVDELHTILVRAGATVTLRARAVDGAEVANVDAQQAPIIVPELPPAPNSYDGQFVQMDVVEIRNAP